MKSKKSPFKFAVVDTGAEGNWKKCHAGSVRSKHRTRALAEYACHKRISKHFEDCIVVPINTTFLKREEKQEAEAKKWYEEEVTTNKKFWANLGI